MRQASLAPQLREAPEPAGRGLRPAEPAGRDPEQARSAMSAFQHGWARGSAPDTHPRTPDRGEAAR
ncbi:putative two-component system sensor kinase [Kitasatospora cheerisanensis KCTC 2395]|uniref:Putative two-component system sensor kinase n=1 Tax=Kitasatospora cheerisanensis KCTC 2395 TaxID=1348663 RepID=A0A066YVA9_9ACTN|nr:putative two-component system sensor kinase [Kitasatospora cheerisanensis KCTC 2395]